MGKKRKEFGALPAELQVLRQSRIRTGDIQIKSRSNSLLRHHSKKTTNYQLFVNAQNCEVSNAQVRRSDSHVRIFAGFARNSQFVGVFSKEKGAQRKRMSYMFCNKTGVEPVTFPPGNPARRSNRSIAALRHLLFIFSPGKKPGKFLQVFFSEFQQAKSCRRWLPLELSPLQGDLELNHEVAPANGTIVSEFQNRKQAARAFRLWVEVSLTNVTVFSFNFLRAISCRR